jgi:hypothetical protein
MHNRIAIDPSCIQKDVCCCSRHGLQKLNQYSSQEGKKNPTYRKDAER